MRHTDFVYTDGMLADAAMASHPSPSVESMLLPFLVDHWSSYVRETTHGRMWLQPFYANSAPPTGLVGPATDAARFLAALLVQYGLGWHIVPEGARLRLQHRGGGPGFGSEMRLYPLEYLGMVVMANDTTYDRDAILDLAARLQWPRPGGERVQTTGEWGRSAQQT
jgi:CubicO group peptidase (beta-lactamase class C family)